MEIDRLGIRLPSGGQLVSFSAPLDRLPEVIDRTLRERLCRRTAS